MLINTLLARYRDVPHVFQTHKCLKKRSAARTCAATHELKKSRRDFFSNLISPVLRAVYGGIRARLMLWFGFAVGFIAGYHALWVGLMVVRFGHWPNFAKSYDVAEAYRLIVAGTPSWSDAVAIMLDEPWFDIGYLSPQWHIVEWSMMILPPQFTTVTLLSLLLATFIVLSVAVQRAPCAGAARRSPTSRLLAATALFGAALTGTTSATLFWVVCCATPTWVVALAMLGVSASLAFLIEPAGFVLAASGLALLGGAIVVQAWRLAIAVAATDIGQSTSYTVTPVTRGNA